MSVWLDKIGRRPDGMAVWTDNLCWHFVYFLNTYGFNFILCLPFVIVWQKMGVFFYYIWFLDQKCIFKPVKCFCPRMAKGGVC
jgi:hypothetical protein